MLDAIRTSYTGEIQTSCHLNKYQHTFTMFILRDYTRVYDVEQIYKRTSRYSLHAALRRGPSHARGQLPPPQVRSAGRPRRGDPEQRLPVGVLEHGVVPGLAGADPGRDGGDVQGPVDHLARGLVGRDGVADGQRACVA